MNTTKDASGSQRSCYSVLFALLLAPAAIAQTAPASAATEEAPPASETMVLEKFVTTGSSIKRTDSEKVLPVTIIYAEDIEARNSSTGMDLLSGIPQVTSIPANETSTNAVAARGGNANVALRGIDQQNTLVLLNGRRIAYNPIATGSAVNVNSLPTTGLLQIEVLRDGASSLYGADAVAGVINYITDSRLDGGSVAFRFFVPEHGGGVETGATLTYGTTFANGKGHFTGVANVLSRDAIYTGERNVSKSPDHRSFVHAGDPSNSFYAAYVNSYNGFSASSPGKLPAFNIGTATPTTGNSRYMYIGANGVPVIPATTGSSVIPVSQYSNYLSGKTTIAQPFSDRGNVFSRIDYELTPKITLFGEATGYLAHSLTGRQSVATTWGDSAVVIGKDNPYNPYGSAFYDPLGAGGKLVGTPQQINILQLQVVDSGLERTTANDSVYRVLGGAKGHLGETWEWESALMFSAYRQTDVVKTAVRDSLIRASALRTGTDAWNPFGFTWKIENGAVVYDKPYTNPSQVVNFFLQRANREAHSKIASWDVRASGDVFELWAGPIKGSAGAEARWELKTDRKDPYVNVNPPDSGLDPLNNDIMVMSPKFDYKADRTIYSLFAETIIPLVAPKNEVFLIESLEVNASARYEKYSDFGNTTKPKFGVNWKPVKTVMVRGSYNEGFRAPDLTTMNQPTSFTVTSPPGATDNAYTNYFVLNGLATTTFFPGTKNYSLANANLTPEESKGLSVGIVFEVPKVKGLSISFDYFEIEQENLIVDAATIYNATYDLNQMIAYTQAQLALGRNILDINVGSRATPTDTTAYVGSPVVLRAPVRADQLALFQQSYARLPQSQWVAPFGDFLGTIAQQVNGTGKNFTNGYDIQVDYNLPRTPIGQFRVTSSWARLLNKYTKVLPTSAENDDIDAMVLPEWRNTTTVQWRKGQWGASATGTYQSDIRTGVTVTKASYDGMGQPSWIIPVVNNGTTTYYEEGYTTLQINLGLTYKFDSSANKWMKDTTVRLGVNNALDEEPPLANATSTGYSGTTGSSLWVGRAWSLSVSRTF